MLHRLATIVDRSPDWLFALYILVPTMALPLTFCVIVSRLAPVH